MLVSDGFVLRHILYGHVCTICTGLWQIFTVCHASTLIHDCAWRNQNCHAIPKLSKLPFSQSHPQSRIPAYSDLDKVSVVNGLQLGADVCHTSQELVRKAAIDLRSERFLNQFLFFCCQWRIRISIVHTKQKPLVTIAQLVDEA